MDLRERLEREESFDGETFHGLDLTGFDFAGKEFSRCSFRNLRLQQSRWHRARLEECAFEDSDLTQMQPLDVRAYEVHFKGCKLMGVEWTKASFSPRLAFEECDLRYATFVAIDLRRTSFLRSKLLEVGFLDADLSDADFSESDLSGANFRGANLGGADFRQAHGVFLDPAKNRVKGARVSMETAALLAASFGMRVAGFDDGDEPRPERKRRRR